MSTLFPTVAQGLAILGGALAAAAISGSADHFTYNRSVWPSPACAQCGARRQPLAVVPLSCLAPSQRRCRICGAPRQWYLDLLLQIVAAVLTLLLLRQYGVGPTLFTSAVETYVLLAVAVTDLQHRLIPTLLVYPAIVFALLTSPWWPHLGPLNSLLGGALAFALFFGLAAVARLAFGDGALGDGDVTLAALIGAICGYPMVVFALALGALAGGLGAGLALLVRRSALGTTIPYGPFLVAGILYVLLAGNTTQPFYGML